MKNMLTTMMKIAAAFAVAAGAVLPSHAYEIAVPSVVTGDAIFWLDASATETLTVSDGKVSQWASRTGSMSANAQSEAARPTYKATTYGIPTVDFGDVGSGKDLAFNTINNIRMAFWVVKMPRHGNVYWLGDYGSNGAWNYTFARGEQGQWTSSFGGERFVKFWDGTNEVLNMTSEFPDESRFLVIAAEMSEGACANRITQDRWIDGHNGGKKLSELILFDRVLTDEERIAVTQYLEAKWHYEPTLMDTAVFWLDASATDTITTNASGEVIRWDSRTGSNYAKQSTGYATLDYPTYDTTTYGIPTVDFGAAKSGKDLRFNEDVSGIRTAFWVTKIQKSADAFWLGFISGTGSDYPFSRGGAGQYTSNYSGEKFAKFWNGTDEVSDMLNEFPPDDKFIVVAAEMKEGGATANSITEDRWNLRNGGKQLSELLLFNRVLTEEERLEVTYYLVDKWMSEYEAEGMKWNRRHVDSATDDGEWGADKYRVFGSDVTIPVDGAAAWGVEFTASAALGGGTLALGHGGFYADSDVTVTVTNAVTGGVNVFGPGTVKFLAQGTTLDALTVGGTARAVLLPGTTIGGKLIMRDSGRLVIDATGLPSGEYGEITVGSYSLPTGGSLLDYVEVLGSGHKLTYDPASGTLMLNEAGIPVAASWSPQDGSTNPKDAANWMCFDAEGLRAQGKLPGKSVTNVTLNAELDLRDWGADVFADGVEIDLKGYSLHVDNLDGVSYNNASIKNTSATTATLEVRVTAASVNNPSATISGNVRFVKSGEGEFVASRAQLYTGGTEVAAGKLKAGIVGTGNPLGAANTELKIGKGATFELNGKGGWDRYSLTLAGGTLQSSSGISMDAGLFTNVTLTADSLISMPAYAPWGLVGVNYDPVAIYLNGHTLNMEIYQVNVSLVFCNTKFVGEGNFHINKGGNFQTGVKDNDAACGEIMATNVSLRVNSPLKLYAPVSIRDYEQVYGTAECVSYDSTAEMKVFGAFKPASHGVFYGCTMQDGSTIDLSNRTGANGLPFYTTSTVASDSLNSLRKTVGFAPGATVTVDLSAFIRARGEAFLLERTDPSKYGYAGDTRIISWDAPPPADVEFVLDAETSASFGGKYRFKRRADGLCITRGRSLSIHLR